MGFHKRHISNDQVIEMYRRKGMQAVYDWYTKGVDALITETGLSSDVSELIGKENDWNQMSEMISDESINKGFN
tara:strand:- start:1442 stop:1663 length:222 start_codon:yes stop_codon:yes gene_type:complete